MISVLIDPEAYRILIGAKLGKLSRVYAIGQQWVRDHDQSGRVHIDLLRQAFQEADVSISDSSLRRTLHEGDGVLWDWHAPTEYVYFYSLARAVHHAGIHGRLDLVKLALDAGKADLVRTNKPGAKLIAVPMPPTLKGWYGNCLAAWHNSRADHTNTISRFTLCTLWGITKRTLLSWEREAHIRVAPGMTQYTDFDYFPVKHAEPYLAKIIDVNDHEIYQVRAEGRHSNAYNPPPMREHPQKRAPRQRRAAAQQSSENTEADLHPTSACDAPGNRGRFTATGRRTFSGKTTHETMQRLRRHLTLHPDDTAPHYICLGYDEQRQCWMYEQSSGDFQRTCIGEKLPRFQADPYFAKHGGRGGIRAAWHEMRDN